MFTFRKGSWLKMWMFHSLLQYEQTRTFLLFILHHLTSPFASIIISMTARGRHLLINVHSVVNILLTRMTYMAVFLVRLGWVCSTMVWKMGFQMCIVLWRPVFLSVQKCEARWSSWYPLSTVLFIIAWWFESLDYQFMSVLMRKTKHSRDEGWKGLSSPQGLYSACRDTKCTRTFFYKSRFGSGVCQACGCFPETPKINIHDKM